MDGRSSRRRGAHRAPRRHVRVAALVGVLALVASACTQAEDTSGATAREALDALQADVGQVQVEAGRLTASDAAFLPDPPEGMVTLQIRFTNTTEGTIGVSQTTEETDRLFATESIAAGQQVPAGDPIKEGIVFAPPGQLGLVELVYDNPTDEDITFMAIAPTIDPAGAHPFAYARCFCASVPFTAPAGGGWYRTIAVGAAPQVPPGAKVVVTWPVLPFVGGE